MNFTVIINKFLERSPMYNYRTIKNKLLKIAPIEAFDKQHPAVFCLSTGRVGTQTLTWVLNLSNNVFAFHEPSPKLFWLSKLSYQYPESGLKKEVLMAAFNAFRSELLELCLDSAKGYVETSPQVTFLAPIILDKIPSAKFIHLVRDPRDVIVSAILRRWYAGSSPDIFRIVPHSHEVLSKQWNGLSPIKKNIWNWVETNQWIRNFGSKLPSEQFLTIKSENLFKNENEILSKLFSFINSNIPNQHRIEHILKMNLNKDNEEDKLNYEKYLPIILNEMNSTSREIARSFGYEL